MTFLFINTFGSYFVEIDTKNAKTVTTKDKQKAYFESNKKKRIYVSESIAF